VARERLIFAPRVGPAEYLARFRLADLVLDTFPYNAGTTASDALWMGTPILTCSGRTYISRMAGSLLTHVGLPDLVTTSLPEYEQLAVQLGTNPLRIASYKRYLAEHGRQSSLFDIPAFVRNLDAEFERLALAERHAPTAGI
jgi:predicted O-linked N-acetylglucosamine transferase (SPINDLY family)